MRYHLVQEHAETFFAQVEAETRVDLPDFVKAEFDAFLECGILANGIAFSLGQEASAEVGL